MQNYKSFKKQLHDFGFLKGLKYFQTFLRSEEELLLIIKNINLNDEKFPLFQLKKGPIHPISSSKEIQNGDLENIIIKTGKEQNNLNHIVFLIAFYSKTTKPYIWLRNHHEKLITNLSNPDFPLELNSTQDWEISLKNFQEIFCEIIQKMFPNQKNPFEIDREFIEEIENKTQKHLIICSLLKLIQNFLNTSNLIFEKKEFESDLLFLVEKHNETKECFNN
ncbi:hypothetical protein M0811_02095 [Anaeramoeba ignava]|uniref:DUF7886 domain-containing protein n=1 Tax=Anaeramoeba ignava TaxID=1746090 RepID=A0A9Q0LCS3_ANAIG|nr:hypothetical protein M0811_02095 [Anaeramoeba ignava]